MLLSLIAAIAVAVFAASVAFVLRRALGIQARWLIPASAGAAMLGFTLWDEYTWFDRTVAALPAQIIVTQSVESSRTLQPWTLIAPSVQSFAAIDRGAIRRHPDHPAMAMVDLLVIERFFPTRRIAQLIDCAQGRRADLPARPNFGGDDLPEVDQWFDLPDDDGLRRAVCDAAQSGRVDPETTPQISGRKSG